MGGSMIEVKDPESNVRSSARILVVGVGGAGNNAVNRMIEEQIVGVEFLAMNTDDVDLKLCKAEKKILLISPERGDAGLGAGSDPSVGREAANNTKKEIKEALEGAQMVFITCGMGGGTGTGAAPVVAEIAKEMDILTLAVVTKPFTWEGPEHIKNADAGIAEIKQFTDTYIVIPNDKLAEIIDKRTSMAEAFRVADKVLYQSVQGITDLIMKPGLINLDFADIRRAMKGKGMAHIGIGVATGDNRAEEAVKAAVESNLVDTSIESATTAIVNVSGAVTLNDMTVACQYVQNQARQPIDIYPGAIEDNSDGMEDTCVVTVIATGLEDPAERVAGFPNAIRRQAPVTPHGVNMAGVGAGFAGAPQATMTVNPSAVSQGAPVQPRPAMPNGNTGVIPQGTGTIPTGAVQQEMFRQPGPIKSSVSSGQRLVPDFLKNRNKDNKGE